MTTLVQRLEFDQARGEVRDQDRRYLLMRPDVLMGTLRQLDDGTRREVLAAFADSTAIHGMHSIIAYLSGLEAAGEDGARALLSLIRETSPALGWGLWDFAPVEEGLGLTVANSPFAVGYGPASEAVCAPIAGMFRTVAGIVLGSAVEVEETACAAMGHHAECRFIARRCPQGDAA